MKYKLFVAIALALILTITPSVAMAAGNNGPAGKSNVGHISLVEKDNVGPDGIPNTGDETWEVIEDGAWGKARYKLSDNMDVVLNAHKLVPGNWYYVEIVDKSSGWNVLNDDRYSRFYGQADSEGNVHISFTWAVSGAQIEINMKNADNVALLDPSTYGVPSEWILGTGQGWGYVLYSTENFSVP